MAAQYVDQYVSLNDKQESMLKQSVNEVKEWHRQKQLPTYISYIDRVLLLKPSEVNVSQIGKEYDQLKGYSRQIVIQVMPHLYDLFMTLDQAQGDELLVSLQEKYQEEYADYKDLSEEENRDKSYKRMVKILEKWIGDLSATQDRNVKQWSLERPLMSHEWLNQQLINKAELQVLFLQSNESSAFKNKFSTTLLEPENLYTQQLKVKLQQNSAITVDMLVQVIQKMSPKQLEHYHDELRDWRKIFVGIASK
ncbi:DUF6279 family lipoprotein [Vibrio hibernica]|uniref:DUF6279 family lipoprotein n=1 Tax=Vibrio hibernica TaxID=2587465 RepID=UPI0039B127E2